MFNTISRVKALLSGDASRRRREIQRLYLEILQEPNPKNYPLDFDTIIDAALPDYKNKVIPLRSRSTVRSWINELVDLGILIRDGSRDRRTGDFFVVNSAHFPDPIGEVNGLPDSSDIGHAGKWCVAMVILLNALLLFIFYSYFMPEVLWQRFTGTVALVTAVLGLGGLRIREAGSFWDAVWDLKTCRWLAASGVTLEVRPKGRRLTV
jgi:hypothetical protein